MSKKGRKREANSMGKRPWTKEEEKILRELYPSAGPAACATRLGRSRNAVRVRAQKLGLQRSHTVGRGRPWTPQEEEYLRRYYRRLPAREIAAELGRTTSAVHTRARRLDLARPGVAMRRVKRDVPPTLSKFFSALVVYWRKVRVEGVQPNVGRFMAEYRKEYTGVS